MAHKKRGHKGHKHTKHGGHPNYGETAHNGTLSAHAGTKKHHGHDEHAHADHHGMNVHMGLPKDLFAHDGQDYQGPHGGEHEGFEGGDHMNGGGPEGGYHGAQGMHDNACDEDMD
jgi:hypothetical protein